jgi:alkanesulfonate monooxygenase SsuD/methylene tetrahydromethanopterin reductase-like flavin-dependent oxidoreductase (luciferase family)
MKIAVVGNALPLYNPPTRVAEEWAMIDVISGGRLIAGMVVGGGPEYFASSINPVFARERFREAHDLIVKAWTAPGPFTFNGKHYRMRYVNPWPRPLQKPHPPIWIPGMGSLETMEFIAAKRYSFMGIPWFHRSVVSKNIELFKKACRSQGYEPSPTQMAWLAPIYVADTDARARAEYERHFWYFVKTLLRGINIQPPGYVNPKSIKNVVLGFAQFVTNVHTWEDVVSGGYAIVGSPETVRQKILEEVRRLGVANLLGLFHIGTLPAAETRRSLELFASEVMPWLKERSIDSVAQTGT